MKTSCKMISYFVQDLLDMSQIKAGKLTKNVQITNINEALGEILSTQEIQAKSKNIAVELKKLTNARNNDVKVEVDAQRIQ